MADMAELFKDLNSQIATAVEKGLRIDGKPGKPTASSPTVADAAGGENDLTSETDGKTPDGNYAKKFGDAVVKQNERIDALAGSVESLLKAFKPKAKDADGDDDGDEGAIMKMLRELSEGYDTLHKAVSEGVLPRLEKAEAGTAVRKSLAGQDFNSGIVAKSNTESPSGLFDGLVKHLAENPGSKTTLRG